MWLSPPAPPPCDGTAAPLTVGGVFPVVVIAALTLAWLAHGIPTDEHRFVRLKDPSTLPATPARLPGVSL
ncbi:MAG: hypothetical protein IID05_08685 [Gemmatimonadetes bacterium]|nr:hypothetical protein [Gemmatimonadota bacterium]